jgi:hypothetical protein
MTGVELCEGIFDAANFDAKACAAGSAAGPAD